LRVMGSQIEWGKGQTLALDCTEKKKGHTTTDDAA